MNKQPRQMTSWTFIGWPFIGQEKLGNHLLNGLRTNRLPKAVLFSGPPALGKKLAAIWLSRASICLAATPRPCDECADCRRSQQQIHPQQVIVQAPDHGRISIETIRAALHRFIVTAAANEVRWLIIPDAENLTEPAANILLKFLEELPPQTRAILTTSRPDELIPTLKSRLTTFYWHLVPAKTLRQNAGKQIAGLDRAAGRPGWLAVDDGEVTPTAQSIFGQFTGRNVSDEQVRVYSVDRQITDRQLDIEELLVRELLLQAAGSERRNLWPESRLAMSKLADRVGLPRLVNLAERYLARHGYSLNIQPRLLYEDLHLV